MADRVRTTKGVSLAKGPVWLMGVAGLAFGILGLLFASTSFKAHPLNGTVLGSTFLGVAGNGWTWLLFAAGGAALMMAAPLHWGAKTMALIVAIAWGAAAVIATIDGKDVFGIFAANTWTKIVWAAAALALLVLAMMPRVGRRSVEADATGRGAAEPAGRRRFSRRPAAEREPAASGRTRE